VSRALVVVLALLAAIHVSMPGIPAPVPVFLGFAAVIGGQCWLIRRALRWNRPYWLAGT
jgi:hypothetical protein